MERVVSIAEPEPVEDDIEIMIKEEISFEVKFLEEESSKECSHHIDELSLRVKSEPENTEIMIKNEPLDDECSSQEGSLPNYPEYHDINAPSCPMVIKEEPPLEIEDLYYNSDLDSSEDSDADPKSDQKEVELKSSKKRRRKRGLAAVRRCTNCQYKTTTRHLLLNHFNKNHPELELIENIEFECRRCGDIFKLEKDYKEHLRVAHRPKAAKSIKVRCNLCKQSYGKGVTSKKHYEKFHPGQEFDFEYKCQECDDFFKTRVDLKEHSKIAHYTEPKTRCNICGILFSVYAKLELHFEISHSGLTLKPDFKCFQCDEFFESTDKLKQHSVVAHETTGGHRGQHFKVEHAQHDNKDSLLKDLDSTSNQSSYSKVEKAIQNQTEPEPESTRKEESKHHGTKPLKKRDRRVNARCNVCQITCLTVANLNQHFNFKHPGFELDPDYKCLECDTYFKTLKDFRKHARVEHPYKEVKPNSRTFRKTLLSKYDCNLRTRCSVCEKVFCTKSYLKEHFKTKHPGLELDFDYKCDECDTFFKTAFYVREHYNLEHG